MAQFEGTIKEFTKFIGGYSRNKVQYLTRNYRKGHQQCEGEGCISRTAQLEAAHLKGKERPIIISEILINFIENDNVKIDLQDYEDLFIAAHNPIESTIKMLCKECHVKYDQKDKIKVPEFVIVEGDTDIEILEEQEAKLIEELISDYPMNKGMAIKLANTLFPNEINFNNSIYSNENKTISVWWLEPSPDKFNQDLYMLLNKPKENKLLIFKIQKNAIRNPKEVFYQRKDKDKFKILIPISDTSYVDRYGFDFNKYKIGEISY